MSSLRTPGRGHYDSEWQLGEWLREDGVSYTTAELGPALDLLESTKRLAAPCSTAQRITSRLAGHRC